VLLTFGTTDGTDADLSYNGSALVLRLNTSPFEVHGDSGYGYVYIRDTVTGLTAGNGLRIGFNGGVARIHNYENTAMEFYNNGTKVWEFTNAGVLKANGAKSITTSTGNLTLNPEGEVVTTKGINFPDAAVASADANTLDDYEEGTWTPVLGGSGGTSGQTYTLQEGTYTKVGNLVTFTGRFSLSAKGTITSTVQIQGLPLTANATYDSIMQVYHGNMATGFAQILGRIDGGGTTASWGGFDSAAANPVTLTTTHIGNSTACRFDGHYYV
jgi:hypothetical protein